MLTCETCGKEIEKNRVEACLELGMDQPTECICCARKKPVNLYLPVHDSKHALTSEIVVVDTTKGKNHISRMKEFHKRGAQRCTSG